MKDIIEIASVLATNYSDELTYLPRHDKPMPSVKRLEKIVEKLREIIFPGYFEGVRIFKSTLEYHISGELEWVEKNLCDEINWSICFDCHKSTSNDCGSCREKAERITSQFLNSLPKLRKMLSEDVRATYDGDPAAKGLSEIIYSYPTIRALINYRIAHELFNLGVALIPRIITELAHSETGIDIHPGAVIGERFMIDHGTGVVIGETCVIGNDVKVYQGVTLGAKSFPVDENGNPIKGINRHPIVEDNVIIYSDATILGRITIGKGSVIGGNVFLAHNIAPGSRVLQSDMKSLAYADGAGI
ncbi:MAG: serine acetyltransferase [Bacteroidales bacterium]